MTIWTKDFAVALGERILATLLQVILGFGTAFIGNGSTFKGWDWQNTLVAIVASAVLALVKGVLANLVTKSGPGLTQSEQVVPPEPQPVGNPGPSVDEPGGPVG